MTELCTAGAIYQKGTWVVKHREVLQDPLIDELDEVRLRDENEPQTLAVTSSSGYSPSEEPR